MKRKGFTLIELLAVIVILAIIALIATPIVMNVIEKAKKGTAARSMENIEHAAEVYYYRRRIDNDFAGTTFTCNGEVCSNGSETLDISGTVPTEGQVVITKEGTISLNSVVVKGYACGKVENKYSCSKANKTTDNSDTGNITVTDNKFNTLSNLKIYGNSYQQTYTGKNLINKDDIVVYGGNEDI